MDFMIKNLGETAVQSPLMKKGFFTDASFVSDDVRIVYDPILTNFNAGCIETRQSFEQAGPRKKIHFQPEETRSAIATCGGLCPGINAVIRSIVMESNYRYGARPVTGMYSVKRGSKNGIKYATCTN